jgi:hypothetical protein
MGQLRPDGLALGLTSVASPVAPPEAARTAQDTVDETARLGREARSLAWMVETPPPKYRRALVVATIVMSFPACEAEADAPTPLPTPGTPVHPREVNLIAREHAFSVVGSGERADATWMVPPRVGAMVVGCHVPGQWARGMFVRNSGDRSLRPRSGEPGARVIRSPGLAFGKARQ